jgi:hypothetical protein
MDGVVADLKLDLEVNRQFRSSLRPDRRRSAANFRKSAFLFGCCVPARFPSVSVGSRPAPRLVSTTGTITATLLLRSHLKSDLEPKSIHTLSNLRKADNHIAQYICVHSVQCIRVPPAGPCKPISLPSTTYFGGVPMYVVLGGEIGLHGPTWGTTMH